VGPVHARFQAADQEDGYVWEDITNQDEVLPTFRGAVVAKILRLDRDAETKRHNRLRMKAARSNQSIDRDSFLSQSKVQGRNNSSNSNSNSNSNGSSCGNSSSSSSSSSSNNNNNNRDRGTVEDIFDIDSDCNSGHDYQQQQQHQQLQSASTDRSVSPPTKAPEPSYVEKEFDRAALAEAREQAVSDKVREALEEKQERDEMQAKEADEIEAARLKHDKKLTSWSTDTGGNKKNVRSLLSSMHSVMWVGNNWKQISVADVIEGNRVKFMYRKAMLVVHPDRCSGMDPETKFLAKRIFEAVNEAYQEFLTKEGL
jgi:hypothetical protein